MHPPRRGTPPAPSATTTTARRSRARATLGRVLRRGKAGRKGYRKVVAGPGEPHLLRTDLGIKPAAGRRRRRKPLIAFAQLSDIHVLDTCNPNGYANGSIDQTQFDWLRALLRRSAHRVVMVFSHHTSSTMDNPLVGTSGDDEPRGTGPKVLNLLLANWEVVAWVNGHTHKNQIKAHKRNRGGGLWEINTASHIDWPQQSRVIELVHNRDKTLSIFTTMVDHAAPRSAGGKLSDSKHLAALGRELAANDWHADPADARGERKARNVELVVRAPKALRKR